MGKIVVSSFLECSIKICLYKGALKLIGSKAKITNKQKQTRSNYFYITKTISKITSSKQKNILKRNSTNQKTRRKSIYKTNGTHLPTSPVKINPLSKRKKRKLKTVTILLHSGVQLQDQLGSYNLLANFTTTK